MAYTDKELKFLKALKKKGVPMEEAFERLRSVQGAKQAPPSVQPKKKGFDIKKGLKGLKEKIVQPASSFTSNVIGGTYEAVGNLAGLAGKSMKYVPAIGPMLSPQAQQQFQRAGEAVQKETAQGADFIKGQAREAFGEHRVAEPVGEFVGRALPQVALGRAVATPTGSGVRQAVKTVAGEGSKLGRALGFVGGTGARSSLETLAYSGATRGETPTGKELAVGAAFDFGAEGLQAGLNKLGNILFSSTIPKSLKERTKQMLQGTDPGEAVSKTGFSINQKSLYKKVGKESQKIADEVSEMISKAGKKTQSLDSVMGDLKTKVKNNKQLWNKLGLTPLDEKKAMQVIDEIADEYRQLYPDNLSLKQLDELKNSLSTGLKKEFQRAATASVRAAPAAQMEIRKSIVDYLDTKVPGYKQKMTEWAPLLEAKGILKKKGAGYSRYLTSVIGGAAYAGGSVNPVEAAEKAARDPFKFVTDFLTGAVLTNVATSTASKTASGALTKGLAKQLEKTYTKVGLKQLLLDLINKGKK